MTTRTRSSLPAFAVAAISLVVAVAAGVDLLGKPLRLVHLVTIIGLSMAAGVSWMLAILRNRRE